MREVHAAADTAFSGIRKAQEALEALDPKASAAVRRQAMRNLKAAIANAPANVEYAGEMLAKHAETVVQKSRADIEAMVIQHAHQLGLTSGESEQVARAIAAPDPDAT